MIKQISKEVYICIWWHLYDIINNYYSCSAGNWTQCLMHDYQTLHNKAHSTSSLVRNYFSLHWKSFNVLLIVFVTWILVSDCAYQEFHSHLSQSYPEHTTASARIISLSFDFILTARQQQKHIRQNWAEPYCMFTKWHISTHCQFRSNTPQYNLV